MGMLIYLAGVTTIFDGVIHLLFPDHWDALWHAEIRKVLPGLGRQLDRLSEQYPTKRRMQGLGWIALGALLLWWAGPAETGEAR